MNSIRVSLFSRRILGMGAGLALLAVAAGAFAAHGLRSMIDAQQLNTFETAARYQMYHALALMIVGLLSLAPQFSHPLLKFAGAAFVVGILLFCGSLYLLALSGIGWLGAVTPIGGVAFLLGWLTTMMAVLKQPPQSA
jgi:uncharacterized membrane protein YgdD (TMEM256/DUF423 family)